jgi:hypothetical protein
MFTNYRDIREWLVPVPFATEDGEAAPGAHEQPRSNHFVGEELADFCRVSTEPSGVELPPVDGREGGLQHTLDGRVIAAGTPKAERGEAASGSGTLELGGGGQQLTLDGRVIAAVAPCPTQPIDSEPSEEEDGEGDELTASEGDELTASEGGGDVCMAAADEDGEGDELTASEGGDVRMAADEVDAPAAGDDGAWEDAARRATEEAARRLQTAKGTVDEARDGEQEQETDEEILRELEQDLLGTYAPGVPVQVAANQAPLRMEPLPVSLMPFSALQRGERAEVPDTGGAASSAGPAAAPSEPAAAPSAGPAAAAAESPSEEAAVLDSYLDGGRTMEVLHLPVARFVAKEPKEGVNISERLELREHSKYAFWIGAVLPDSPLVQSLASAADDAQRRELLDSRRASRLGKGAGPPR